MTNNFTNKHEQVQLLLCRAVLAHIATELGKQSADQDYLGTSIAECKEDNSTSGPAVFALDTDDENDDVDSQITECLSEVRNHGVII
jgi:hypothetical protein